jgi:hypothetical protein
VIAGLYVGIDLGTSGVRAVAIDDADVVHGAAALPLPPSRRDGRRTSQNPLDWWDGVQSVLEALCRQVGPRHVRAIAVDGTSGTLLLADVDGRPLGEALMYDDASTDEEAGRIARHAPSRSAAAGSGSALARLLHLSPRHPQARHALHQADWIAGRLTRAYGTSDENNALKLGYDPVARRWPAWLAQLGFPESLLPRVVAPGTAIGVVANDVARPFGLADDVRVVAGTTDGVAAFLCTGAGRVGDAVTSLGSTLVVKVLCEQPIVAPEFGIYSHRIGDAWLAGGASNAGAAALLQFFDLETIRRMSRAIDAARPTGLDYYPLVGIGERFPTNDPAMHARTSPRPADDTLFLQGLLEGIAAVERRAYRRLESLGALYPAAVRTVGGGAANDAWTAIRSRTLGVTVTASLRTDAAFGAALLARQGAIQ